jgi:hypothetical protein
VARQALQQKWLWEPADLSTQTSPLTSATVHTTRRRHSMVLNSSSKQSMQWAVAANSPLSRRHTMSPKKKRAQSICTSPVSVTSVIIGSISPPLQTWRLPVDQRNQQGQTQSGDALPPVSSPIDDRRRSYYAAEMRNSIERISTSKVSAPANGITSSPINPLPAGLRSRRIDH